MTRPDAATPCCCRRAASSGLWRKAQTTAASRVQASAAGAADTARGTTLEARTAGADQAMKDRQRGQIAFVGGGGELHGNRLTCVLLHHRQDRTAVSRLAD